MPNKYSSADTRLIHFLPDEYAGIAKVTLEGELVWIETEDTDNSLREADDVGQPFKCLHCVNE